MDRDLAVEMLIALACCSLSELHCDECPLWDERKGKCRPWTTEEVTEAVYVLKKEKENG